MNREQMEAHLRIHGWEPIVTGGGRWGYRDQSQKHRGAILDKNDAPMEIWNFWTTCTVVDEFILSDRLFWSLVDFMRRRIEAFPR